MKQATFFGEFNIGEYPEDFHNESLLIAKQKEGDLFCLVNDIGLPRKVVLYSFEPKTGKETIIQQYERTSGNWCGSRGCRIVKDWDTVVNDSVYKYAREVLLKKSVEISLGNPKLHATLREEVVPDLIRQRFSKDYKDINFLTERYLRNFTSRRLGKRKRGVGYREWKILFEEAGILDRVRVTPKNVNGKLVNGPTTCGGILLGLFYSLTIQGYQSVEFLIAPETQGPLENGLELLAILQKHTNDPEWAIDARYTIIQ